MTPPKNLQELKKKIQHDMRDIKTAIKAGIKDSDFYEGEVHGLRCALSDLDILQREIERFSENCKKRYDETFFNDGEIAWTIHGAILALGIILGTHSIEDVLDMRSEKLQKSVGVLK